MKWLAVKSGFLSLNLMLGLFLLSSSATAAGDWKRLFPQYPTHGFNNIYSVSASNVFAVGNYGLIYHYNGSSWAEMESPVAVNLNGIWGRSANDIFAVGNDGTIIWYNGTAWKKLSSPTSSNLFCVWGFDGTASQVYVGGRNGEILVYSDGTWTKMETPLADGIWNYTTINSIWGDSASNLYAVGQTQGDVNKDVYLRYSGGSSWIREYNPSFGDTGTTSKPGFVIGFVGNDVYLAGRDGTYRLINGNWASWEKILPDTFNGMWGASHESIWFVNASGITHYNGNSSTVLSSTTAASGNNIWGNSDTDLFTVTGADGEIHHFQGEAWSSMTKAPDVPVQSVCGVASDELYAVGDNGMILYFNGEYWAPMESASNENLHSACGSGNAVFAVGDSGTVLFYNGSQWNTVNSGTTETLYDTWCYSATAAYVVGSNGTILNCSSAGCSPETTDGTPNHLYAVHHSTMGPYAGGANGVMLHKETTTWNQIDPVPLSVDVMDLWGDPAFGLVAIGEQYIHSYDNTLKTWKKEYESPTTLHLKGVTGSSISDLYAVGYGGTSWPYDGIVLHKDGATTQEVKTFTDQHLTSVWLASGELFTGSDSSTVYRYDETHWSDMIAMGQLRDVWGSSPDDLFVVGDAGRVIHYNGTLWAPMESGTAINLESVYVAESGQWAVAGGWPNPGELIRYDGSDWSPVSIPTTESISDLWGSGSKILAVARGTVLSSSDSGMSWQEETTPVSTGYLNAVWGAGFNGPFFAVGDDAEILTSGGSGTWSSMNSSALSSLRFWSIWGSSGDNVYAVGHTDEMLGSNESQIVHFDGTSWQSDFYSYNVLPAQYMNAVWGRSQSDLFTFGSLSFRNDGCSSGWEKMNIPGIPPLESAWGIEGADGVYYVFGVADLGQAVYQFTITADRKCPSSPWNLFLPAILNGK